MIPAVFSFTDTVLISYLLFAVRTNPCGISGSKKNFLVLYLNQKKLLTEFVVVFHQIFKERHRMNIRASKPIVILNSIVRFLQLELSMKSSLFDDLRVRLS